MKKLLDSMVAVVLLCTICFLCGEWPEGTKLSKVLLCDGTAFAIAGICGLYLRRNWKRISKRNHV